MKVAIVYDWVNRSKGGAERVLTAIHQIWPKAPLFTSVYDPSKASWAKKFPEVKASFVNKIPLAKSRAYWFYPLILIGFEQFNFDQYDLVISVTTGPAKAIITKPETKHVCYCLTPPTRHILNKNYFPFNLAQKQDYIIGQRPDFYLATCKNVTNRIKKYYNRIAKIVFPGIDLQKFKPKTEFKLKNYFLVVSRLVDHKKVDLAVRAFNQLGWPLKIVGKGRGTVKLKSIAKPNIKFLGNVSDEKLVNLYQQCQAVIFPQEEDFGLVSIEAQACGRPVIAYQAGGALETVNPGKTGEFFSLQTPKALIDTLKKFNSSKYSSTNCRANAENFSQKSFKSKFKQTVDQLSSLSPNLNGHMP
jgi:glycosyltransferase involved in cell wall biosynthesis